MTNPIARTKEFVHRNRTRIAFGSGTLVGAGAVAFVTVKYYGGTTFCPAHPEDLQKMIDSPESGIVWTHALGKYLLVNTANPDLTK